MVFVRRYPKRPADLDFDLFLGKPALLVEHHSFFRNGYSALTEFVDKLNSLDRRLEWTSLAKICSRTCLKRVAENGEVHVLFYTDRFWLQNDTDRHKNYLLFRRVLPEDSLTGVKINGQLVDFEQKTEALKIPLFLNTGQAAEVRIERGEFKPVAVSFKQMRMHNAWDRVFIRRLLSEWRDNYLDKNLFLSRMASNARRLFARAK